MSIPNASWALLAQLADGQRHHIRNLAARLGHLPAQLNGLWQQLPEHIRNLLRQHDGQWHLLRPLAILDTDFAIEKAIAHGFQAAVIPQCDSSNDLILALARQTPAAAHRQLRLTYWQNAGRGRQGRQWHSRVGECLMLSLGWCFDLPQTALGGLALAVAVAVQRSLADNGVDVQIKWPNDVVLGADKLGGILIETMRQGEQTVAIIGIGLNYVLPKTIANATAIQSVAPTLPAAAVYVRLLDHLADILPQFARHGLAPFQAAYTAIHRDHGQIVHLLREGRTTLTGTVIGVNENGALRLHTETGEQHVVSGEISLRPGVSVTRPPYGPTGKYLLLDGGNSKLKWAWVQHGKICHSGKASYADLRTLATDWQTYGHDTERIVGAAVCGPARQALVAAQLPLPIKWLGSMPQALGIRNHYRNPAEHGADRWFNILGSRRYTRHACVVVSSGTAVTIDALTDDNHYLGGSILPGLYLMKEAMASHTANLNRPLGRHYPFATTTPNALASGIADAISGAVLLMHQRLQQRVGQNKPVDILVTGGGAARVVQTLPIQFTLDNRVEIVDNLVIYGLLNWVEQA